MQKINKTDACVGLQRFAAFELHAFDAKNARASVQIAVTDEKEAAWAAWIF